MRLLTLLFSFILITGVIGCSQSDKDTVRTYMNQMKQLNQENSVIDTIVSKTDLEGKSGDIIGSHRDPGDDIGNIYRIVDELDSLNEVVDKPQIPEYYYEMLISAQDKNSLKTFDIRILVDPDITYIKWIDINSSDKKMEGIQINKDYELSENLKTDIKQILNSVSD
ncbi:hypothetical protein [Paenibacillus sp. PDC88]|uniref:hypothetical protein n=1 Tax=Paenibacillus sp. PDC88 TaxID=1884375 RepID=UPI000899B8D3|nr:hypothetical protein [Paenibacillus sp. PDC88]SDX86871.1 hypothetical protein SAMN05518848_12119 [Paenibacillus sp. PDC88]